MYNTVNPKVTAKLREIALVNPNVDDPRTSDRKGMADANTLNTATINLSNLAILNALSVNSRSLCAVSSNRLLPKAPHHMRPLSSASDLYTDSLYGKRLRRHASLSFKLCRMPPAAAGLCLRFPFLRSSISEILLLAFGSCFRSCFSIRRAFLRLLSCPER